MAHLCGRFVSCLPANDFEIVRIFLTSFRLINIWNGVWHFVSYALTRMRFVEKQWTSKSAIDGTVFEAI